MPGTKNATASCRESVASRPSSRSRWRCRQIRRAARAGGGACAAAACFAPGSVTSPAALERALRANTASLRRSLAAALAEGYAPSLVIPPRGDPRVERTVLRSSDLSTAQLRVLLAAGRPLLVLPD
jgi:hypothetical protein